MNNRCATHIEMQATRLALQEKQKRPAGFPAGRFELKGLTSPNKPRDFS